MAEKNVRIRLFKDNSRYKGDLFVSVNGVNYKIRRGVEVEVPPTGALSVSALGVVVASVTTFVTTEVSPSTFVTISSTILVVVSDVVVASVVVVSVSAGSSAKGKRDAGDAILTSEM